jgi:succinoglycan biosynthesis protein ExoA
MIGNYLQERIDRPAVSIIVPCRNEKNHIEICARSILAQEQPPGGIEVIFVDGMSQDGTREILMRLTEEHPRLRVIENFKRSTPCAMNIGIQQARGHYIAILGAHTEYAPSYVRMCIEILEEHPEVDCAGGTIISCGKSIFGRATAVAMAHPLGVGNSKGRFPNYEGYAYGACFPVFRREVFDQVGLYDEKFIRNQDDEFNFRVTRSGRKIYVSPRARCSYYVRETPAQLFWQYFQYGYWRVAVIRKHRRPASIYQVVPAGFYVLTLIMLVFGLFLPGWWRLIAAVLPLTYASILGIAGMDVAIKNGVRVGLLFPFAAAIMHFGYAVGFLWGVVRCRMTANGQLSLMERDAQPQETVETKYRFEQRK